MTIPEIQNKELHRIVTTTIIYRPDFTYLITKRSLNKKVQPGKWCFPGGGLSTDDYTNTPQSTLGGQWYGALENALRREVKEEVNVEVGKLEFFIDFTYIIPNGTPVLGLTFFAPYVSGEVALDEDCTEFAWVTVEEAATYDIIKGVLGELQQVDAILKARK